jgi:hypothetical protein
MAFFSQRKRPEQLGLDLAERLKKVIDTIPNMLSSIEHEDLVAGIRVSFEDIDKIQIIKELTILTYVGQRLAIQLCQKKKGGDRAEDERKAILNVYDSYALEYLDKSPEFRELLNPRGEQYFQLVQSHLDEFHRGEWNKFFEILLFEFEQFCRGGGEQNDPIIIGSCFPLIPMKFLSGHYWSESFMWTFKYLIESE